MNRTELELKAMGKFASSKYLDEQVPMNDTILQLTKTASLNPHQVARVCEAANINTYDTLWGMHKNAEFVFDMADQEKIAEAMNATGKEASYDETTVSVNSIRDLLPSDTKIASAKNTAGLEKVAAAITDYENQVNISETKANRIIAKLAQLKDELDFQTINAKRYIVGAEDKLTQCLKEAALRGEDISMAYAAGRIAFPNHTELINHTFMKVAENLKKYNISFLGSHKQAEAKVISETAKGVRNDSVVNKANPVIKSLNTIVDNHDCICDSCHARDYIVSKIDSIKKGIRRHDMNKE